MKPLPEKPCVRCGRTITWRKKWERDWDTVKYCSDKCRSRGEAKADPIEAEISALLAQRATDSTICPSEVAKKLRPEDWRPLMEPVREAARRMVARGELEITQQGRAVDPSTARGAIRLRRKR